MSEKIDGGDIPGDELDPHERRVVSVDPVTAARGNIEVVAVRRGGGVNSDQIERHWFKFGYHYLGDDRSLSLGLGEWNPPSETVGAGDMAMLKYVIAYFDRHGIPVDVSIPVRDYEIDEFDADATLEINSDPSDGEETDTVTAVIDRKMDQ